MTHKLPVLAALLLALGLVAPARATITVSAALGTSPFYVNATQNSTVSETIVVASDGALYVQAGGTVQGLISVQGGAVDISGGSVSASTTQAIAVVGGSVTISGGSVSADFSEWIIEIASGTVTLSGGTVSGAAEDAGVVVYQGGTLTMTGGSVMTPTVGIADDGTVTVSGGAVSGGSIGIRLDAFGSASISGGSVSGNRGIDAENGTTTVSGGSVSGTSYGIYVNEENTSPSLSLTGGSVSGGIYKGVGEVSVSGCGLVLAANGVLTGNLADGTPISTPTQGLTPADLQNGTPTFTLLQPVNADGSSVFKAGSTVPVKFTLTGACSTNVMATLSFARISSGVLGDVNEAASTSAASTGNQFRYTGGQYAFNWSTKGLSAGTYQLQIDLGNGMIRIVNLGLK